eukprot:TRINITY_DN32819_c0_g1_i1.p1 TRINITY_DN32819_c0_g1~~TRINITY_DN32819_c0_g1_i1.p1  ORF type:complete len:301 (+),score=53.25 TRINITY_DN32819_c0_g1_i1:181-1083(+)
MSTPVARDIPAWGHFLNSGVSGIIGWCFVHPLNTVAVSMGFAQTEMSSIQMARHIMKEGGVAALYNGLSAGIIRQIVYTSSRLSLFDIYKDIAVRKFNLEMNFPLRMALATLAGGCAAIISCPVEVSLVRMTVDQRRPAEQRVGYRHFFHALGHTAERDGVLAFWRGCQPFVMRCMLVGASQVGSYDQFKAMYQRYFGLHDNSLFVAASLSAGLLYSVVTMPFETAKNRMASEVVPAGGQRQYRTTFGTIASVARAQGPLGLFNGFLPYYGRCGGHTLAMFLVMEQLRKLWPAKQPRPAT